ncbi:DUF551 domain-containing protein [Klebsiella aerogenes]|uniref:DUF551 domain-containing protein n=1 Tax=Klebsiella aerogenes TaxID=548 RepID=UPI0007B3D21C|nr:DUF551 domain-containing protein [Klebsiella aerogenes]KZR10470.1 hypothetical protein A3N54_05710 [Klebsiella aerogenes]
MTKSTITREMATDKEIQMLIDSHENGTAMFMRTDAYYFMAKELQERRKADSEPVGYFGRFDPDDDDLIDQCSKNVKGAFPLYRHAQQPVVPEKATVGEMPFLGTSEGAYVRGWNDCRAAMLQAEPVTTANKLGNSPAQSPIDHGYRPGCECSGCKTTVRICAELAGWIPVSERMPENEPGSYEYLVFETLNNRVNHDYWNVPDKDGDAFTPFWNYYSGHVTHWMPLPAAPQEVGDA